MKKRLPAQTQKGKYSSRLSNTLFHGTHEDFRMNDDFFRLVVQSLEDYAIFTTDKYGIISSWNRGAQKVLGYREEEVIGKNARLLFTKEDIKNKIPEKELRRAIKEGKSLDQRWHLKKGKVIFWASGYMFPLKDNNGKIRGFAKIMRDLTETKNARLAFEKTQERLALAQKVGKIGTFEWLIPDNRIIWSPELEELYGLEVGSFEETYEYWLEKIHPEDRKMVVDNLTASVKKGEPLNIEFRIISPNGKVHSLLAKGDVFLNEKGKPIRMIGVNIDICDLKDLQHERDQFISIASHELKTPVTSLKLFADILHRNIEKVSDPAIVEPTQMIKTQVNRLMSLMNDLLDVSRIQSKKLELAPQAFNLLELIKDIVSDKAITSPSHKISIDADLKKSIYADKERISQVLTNLISNAIKYSPQADRVVIKVREDGKNVVVCVQDFGIGISEEDQEKIFGQFFRSIEAKNKHIPGFGLGLHISSEIIKKHGGKIWFKSTKGKGTSFYFSFPMKLKEKSK